MNAPLILIVLPLFLGLLALALRKIGPDIALIYAGISLILAWMAWQIPIDQATSFGTSTIKISSVLSLLGRSLTLRDIDRPLLAFVFLANAIWLSGSLLARPGKLFAGISQIALALFVAALSVDPFLYAAIFLALIVLSSIPMMARPGEAVKSGLLRYLNFQLFGVPFILFVGWLLAGVEASPGNSSLVFRAGIMLALGFSFLMAVFPFHSWLPMMAEEVHPFSYAFIVFLLPFGASIFGLGFFERFAWLRELQGINQALPIVGALIAAIGGLWAAIQNNVGRQLGFIMVSEIGLMLVAIGIGGQASVQSLFALTIVRLLALFTWAISVSGLSAASRGSMDLSSISRIIRRHPIFFLGLSFSLASFAGLPLTAGFFPKFTLAQISANSSSYAALGIFLGQLGIAIAFLRTLLILGRPLLAIFGTDSEDTLLGIARDPTLRDRENPLLWLFLVLFVGIGLLLAFSPQSVMGNLHSFALIFPQIAQ